MAGYFQRVGQNPLTTNVTIYHNTERRKERTVIQMHGDIPSRTLSTNGFAMHFVWRTGANTNNFGHNRHHNDNIGHGLQYMIWNYAYIYNS